MADLLNHKRPRDTKWTFDNSVNAFTITSLCALKEGVQVYDSYGRKCNSRFFVNYGFSLEENEDNETLLEFEVDYNDELYAQKIRLLGNDSKGSKRYFPVSTFTRDRKIKEMFSFCRFACASSADLERFPSSYSFMLEDISPINISNEIQTLQMIKRSAQLTLERFDCSIAEDNILLASSNLTMNQRNCVLMRRGEKQVCEYFTGLADACIPLLSLQWVDYQLSSSAVRIAHPEFDAYITDTVRHLVHLK